MQPVCSKHRLFLNNVKRQTLAIFGIIVAKSYAIRETTYLLFSCQANICWSSRHVLKTSSTHLQRNNFTSSKTSWRRLGRRKIVTLKTSWRHVLKTSWRHILKTSSRRLGGKQNFYWWYLYLTNLNVYLTNLCFTNLYLTNLRRIQNALLRTQ